jgi:sugar-specific transcriptional regulator TrmB
VKETDYFPFHVRALSPEARELYGRIARREEVTDADSQVVEELRSRHLVGVDPGQPDLLVALDPQEAGRRYLHAGLQDLAARAARMADIPDAVDELVVHYERARCRSGAGSEFLADAREVNAQIEVALSRATCELLTAQPGGDRSRKLLDIAVDRDSRALAAGVSVRTLYRDTVRDDPVTREWATVMTRKGAQFRTMAAPFRTCIIIDRREAFISDHVADRVPAHSAWHVMDRAMVGFVAEVFEDSWRRADIWNGDPRTLDPSTQTRTTPHQREILRDTAAGIEQRVTANRLGISVRKLSGEIGKLREMWGVATLAELTYQWALSPERLIDDQPEMKLQAA